VSDGSGVSSSRDFMSAALTARPADTWGSLVVFDIRSSVVACRTRYSRPIITLTHNPSKWMIQTKPNRSGNSVQKCSLVTNGPPLPMASLSEFLRSVSGLSALAECAAYILDLSKRQQQLGFHGLSPFSHGLRRLPRRYKVSIGFGGATVPRVQPGFPNHLFRHMGNVCVSSRFASQPAEGIHRGRRSS
jgi:hypothetical protein